MVRALFKTPETASAKYHGLNAEAFTALENKTNFEKKPPSGGTPAKLRRKTSIEKARNGIRRLRPLYASMSSGIPRDSVPATTRNDPAFIAPYTKTWSMPPTSPNAATYAALSVWGGLDCRATAPTASAIRMYPAWAMLEYASMRLIERWGIATMFPTVCVTIARIARVATQSTCTLSKPIRKTRNSATMPTFFEAEVRRTLIVVGEPWYTSGAHMWNGTTATLNPKPAISNTSAMIRGGSIAGSAVRCSPVPRRTRSVVAPIDVLPALP